MTELLAAVPLGFVLGVLIGLTGVGGGALVAPTLYVVLGRSYAEAVALSLVYSFLTKIASAVQHVRQGTVHWRLSLLYGLTGIPGAIVGSRLVYAGTASTPRLLALLMGAILLFAAALIALDTRIASLMAWEKPFSPNDLGWPIRLAVALIQLVVGALLGLTSVGSGSLVILSMVYLFRMSAREIIGSNIVIALLMVVPAGLTHYLTAGVPGALLGALLIGSLGGALIGARMTMWFPDRPLKLATAGLIALGAVATIVKAW
ncbi:MAG TPA: sulfite exporter TauE/SafE family protein [Methylomirabilota bacterium]|nr:sulfite exporter TauE/SafE family protein [Methylomirabilota bacterium]